MPDLADHAVQNPTVIGLDRPLFAIDWSYTDRASKARWIAERHASILAGAVLDIGCDQRQLAGHLPPAARYTGVDLSPSADVQIDLDRQTLPFADRSFDTVIASDVLEHLEHLHRTFDEVCRVASRHVIVSLPNCVRTLVVDLPNGSGGRLKHYGLPIDPPTDRHRWFFGYEEAARFVIERGRRAGFAVVQMQPSDRGVPPWTNERGENALSDPNIWAGTLWAVLERVKEVRP